MLCTCWHGGCGMAGTRWPGRVGSQGRGDDNRRKLGLGGWGTHQVVVLGTGRLKSSPQVQRRTVCYSRRFQFKAQPGRFGTHKSWKSDSLSQWEGGGYGETQPPLQEDSRQSRRGPSTGSLGLAVSRQPCRPNWPSLRIEVFEARTKCLSFPEEPCLKRCWGAGSWTGQRCCPEMWASPGLSGSVWQRSPSSNL